MTQKQFRDAANGPWEDDDLLFLLAEAIALDCIEGARRVNCYTGFISRRVSEKPQEARESPDRTQRKT